LCWFNPLVHVAAYLMRIDQELACDAQVIERHPNARRTYAEALLKAEFGGTPPPLGCYWPPDAQHPLTERVAMLKQAAPGRARRLIGVGGLVVLAAGAGLAAWAAQPQRVVYVEAPQPVIAPPVEQSSRADLPASQLSIIAVKPGFLEVRSAKGEYFVRRMFKPGESYIPRIGAGWTASADDGAAFEWRLGARSLGLMAPKGGPVASQSVDAAAQRPAEGPQPIPSSYDQASSPQTPRAAQQLPIQAPFPGWTTPTSNDNWEPVAISGTITSVKWVNPSTQIFVHGDDGKDWYILSSTPNRIFRSGGSSTIIAKDVRVVATGRQDLSIACAPRCVAMAREEEMTFNGAKLTPAGAPQPVLFQTPPAPAASPEFSPAYSPVDASGVQVFVPVYLMGQDRIDPNSPVTVTGKVTSVKWVNPSTQINIRGEDGKDYVIQTGTPNSLLRGGFTKSNLQEGVSITAMGHRERPPCTSVCAVFVGPDRMTIGAKALVSPPN
ncbi:MAG TPA: DUF6152 family protein, partial [Hyphomonadaceae bacterium]|nr:DUF6152 family protein [Hyphomonadaceae bacterium]